MGRIKMDRAHRLAVPLILLALILCLALLVGTAWARYRYRETTDLLFTQKTASQVYLWGGIQSDGSFSAMPADFTTVENGQELSFLISNGQSRADFSQHTQQAQVRLFCSLGLGDSGNLSAVLTVDETDYNAVAVKIDTGSPMYASFGEGWAYCFVDEDGNELLWELEGGQLSVTQMKLTIHAAPGLDPSALRLTVSAEG